MKILSEEEKNCIEIAIDKFRFYKSLLKAHLDTLTCYCKTCKEKSFEACSDCDVYKYLNKILKEF